MEWSWKILTSGHRNVSIDALPTWKRKITSLQKCTTTYSDWHQWKHQSSSLLTLCKGNHPWLVDFLCKRPVMGSGGKVFAGHGNIMTWYWLYVQQYFCHCLYERNNFNIVIFSNKPRFLLVHPRWLWINLLQKEVCNMTRFYFKPRCFGIVHCVSID